MAESTGTISEAHVDTNGGGGGSFGQDLADQLFDALHTLQELPLDGARDLPVLDGLTRGSGFDGLQENVLARAIRLLRDSGRVYVYGGSILFEAERLQGDGRWLVPLRSGNVIEPRAENWLANIMVCEYRGKQFPPPRRFVEVLLTAETLRPALPRIEVYASRPLFDADFVLQGPGWHPGPGILVHGPAVEPAVLPPPPAGGRALDRLPPHLRTLFQGFCFRADADLVNAVALLLTGLLVNHFVRAGKPIGLVDGNQPNTGKSWLVRALGTVLDGAEPPTLFYTADDEELQKRICAKLREGAGSVLLIDNAKMVGGGAVSSPMIESLSVAPEVSLRILGVSATYTRPNDLVWTITMNDTRTSPDLVSRGLPVQLFYEGRPEDRVFVGPNPIDYARENRLAILGELAGMIVRWIQQGRPDGARSHRLQHWARVVGGILAVANLPEFLANQQDAAAAFNSASDELAALAEAVVAATGGPFVVVDDDGVEVVAETETRTRSDRSSVMTRTNENKKAVPAADWEAYFRQARVRTEELEGNKSARSKAVCMGKFLSQVVGRVVPIQVHGRIGTAELRVFEGRGREKRYGLRVRWDPEATPTPASAAGTEPLPAEGRGAVRAGAPTPPPPAAAVPRPVDVPTGDPATTNVAHHKRRSKMTRLPAGAGTIAAPPAKTSAARPSSRSGNSEQW